MYKRCNYDLEYDIINQDRGEFMTKKKRKKRYHLKMGVIKFIVYFTFFLIVGIYAYKEGTKIHNEYLYQQTNEYKLSEVGYSKTEVSLLLEKLSKERIEQILNEPYNEAYYLILSQKYYLDKNLDKYLEYAQYHIDDKIEIELNSEEMSEEEQEKYIKEEKYKRFIAIINVHANEGWYNVTYETNLADDYLILVNKFYHLPDNYTRDDIKNISLEYAYSNQRAAEIVVNKFEEMRNKVLEELNVHLMVNSSYRPYSEQNELYTERKNLWGQKQADMYAARPGHSEHQTALSIDITSLEHPYDTQFMESEEYNWLLNNAHKYGFILRYPKGKSDITGYSNESWHFRYVGEEVAKQIYEEGITFDEYYAYYIEK